MNLHSRHSNARGSVVDVPLTLGQRMYLLALMDEYGTTLNWGRNRRVAVTAKLLASMTPDERHALNRVEPEDVR